MATEFQKSIDVDALRAASRVTTSFMQEKLWDKVGGELLIALSDKSNELLSEGVRPEDVMFTSKEWADLVSGSKDQDQASRYIRSNLKVLEDFLAENRDELDASLRLNALNERLVIRSTGSKGGRKNHYFMSLEPIEASERSTEASNSEPINKVVYKVRRLVKPPFWAKPFLEFRLKSARGVMLLGMPFVVALLSVYLIMAYSGATLTLLSFGFVALVAVGYKLFKPFYDVNEKRVVSAPYWVLGWSDLYAQIDFLGIDEKGWFDKQDKALRVVVYESECPICSCPIHVEEGDREYKGRLLGRCARAPEEHVFSFDHTTKTGFPLRNTADYLAHYFAEQKHIDKERLGGAKAT